jgi:hypothetical protein
MNWSNSTYCIYSMVNFDDFIAMALYFTIHSLLNIYSMVEFDQVKKEEKNFNQLIARVEFDQGLILPTKKDRNFFCILSKFSVFCKFQQKFKAVFL